MSQAQPCIEYDPACVECRRDAGKDAAGTTWQCIGHAYLERDRLLVALATMTHKAATLADERNTHLAESVERAREIDRITANYNIARAALATAQAERSEALMECNCAVLERDAALQRAEQAEAALAQAQKEAATCRHNYAVLCETGQRNEAAQPPALPPLPEGWEEEHDGAVVRFTTQSRNTEMGVVADRYDVRFITPWRMVPKINVADLLIVLRHAEAAHQRLKEGQRV